MHTKVLKTRDCVFGVLPSTRASNVLGSTDRSFSGKTHSMIRTCEFIFVLFFVISTDDFAYLHTYRSTNINYTRRMGNEKCTVQTGEVTFKKEFPLNKWRSFVLSAAFTEHVMYAPVKNTKLL